MPIEKLNNNKKTYLFGNRDNSYNRDLNPNKGEPPEYTPETLGFESGFRYTFNFKSGGISSKISFTSEDIEIESTVKDDPKRGKLTTYTFKIISEKYTGKYRFSKVINKSFENILVKIAKSGVKI